MEKGESAHHPGLRDGEIRMSPFRLLSGASRRTVRVPVVWDASIGEWMMTVEGLRAAEKAKLALVVSGWIDGLSAPQSRRDVRTMVRRLATRILSLAPARTRSSVAGYPGNSSRVR